MTLFRSPATTTALPSTAGRSSGHARESANNCRTETRSEEHTSELQSLRHLVCRLLLVTAPDEISPLSLHDALPISCHHHGIAIHSREILRPRAREREQLPDRNHLIGLCDSRSEEHTSELQSLR